MNRTQAQAINIGDGVTFGGHVYTVASIKTSGIAAPYFRLAQGPEHGLVSYELCGRVIRNADAIQGAIDKIERNTKGAS